MRILPLPKKKKKKKKKVCEQLKGYDFGKSDILRVVLPSCVIFLTILCLKEPLNCTCIGVLLHYYRYL